MAKFGEIVSEEKPVLVDFFVDLNEENEDEQVLRDVAAALGDKARVVKIDIQKNEALADALKVKANPTYILYKSGEMLWRESGHKDANALITTVQQFV